MKVFIIAAVSADGFIGADAAQSSLEWRSKADGRFFSQATREAGVIVMGAGTYKTFRIKRAPPGRRLIVYTTHPESIEGESVETTAEEPRVLIERLEAEGANGVAIGGGAIVNKMFMDAGLVDELYLTVEPVLFGAGVPLLAGGLSARLSLLDCRDLAPGTILLHYAVQK